MNEVPNQENSRLKSMFQSGIESLAKITLGVFIPPLGGYLLGKNIEAPRTSDYMTLAFPGILAGVILNLGVYIAKEVRLEDDILLNTPTISIDYSKNINANENIPLNSGNLIFNEPKDFLPALQFISPIQGVYSFTLPIEDVTRMKIITESQGDRIMCTYAYDGKKSINEIRENITENVRVSVNGSEILGQSGKDLYGGLCREAFFREL